MPRKSTASSTEYEQSTKAETMYTPNIPQHLPSQTKGPWAPLFFDVGGIVKYLVCTRCLLSCLIHTQFSTTMFYLDNPLASLCVADLAGLFPGTQDSAQFCVKPCQVGTH